MCHINVIINKKQKVTSKIVDVINTMTYASYKTNKDGDGAVLFNKDKTSYVKNTKKNLYIGKFNAIVSHQRFATGGTKDVLNAHPHIGKRFLLIHNGVMSSLGDRALCDTGHFLKELEEKIGDKKDIYEPLKEYLATISGTFSMFLWDNKYKKLYYFKEYSTNMVLVENDEWLVMSTSKENVEYANWVLGINDIPEDVKHEIIWEVSFDGTFTEIGTFKKKEYVSSYYGYNNLSYYKSPTKKEEDVEKSYEEICEENKNVIQKALDYIRGVKDEV
jgi:glucosamine 6-phosphate synthetase-like amidotransferase/phosphosugar isomerase protein